MIRVQGVRFTAIYLRTRRASSLALSECLVNA